MTASEIVSHGDRLFSGRSPILAHWQELAEHFYYDRAIFTSPMNIGEDYAAYSMSSTAALARREMGNMYRTMLRPQAFFEVGVGGEKEVGSDATAWLQYASKQMRTDMYRKGANFTRATTLTDHDHATFGQGVVEIEVTPDRENVYFHNYHLKDVAWSVDYAGNIEAIHRNCSPTVSSLIRLFGENCPKDYKALKRENPNKPIRVRKVVAPVGLYDIEAKGRHEYLCAWVDCERQQILESITRPFKGYVIPRADLVDGSVYAKSPFTSIILPDARTKQAIERILLEAGEKAVDPPMIAQKEAIRGDFGLYAGGVTMVDSEYDERLGAAIRPLTQDRSGLPVGLEMSAQYDRVIVDGMMLNKINLPETNGDRTAYETRKLIEQHMRSNVPMWEPVEAEYNEPLVSEIFDVLSSIGRFPSEDIPSELRGQDIEFEFKSPIKDMEKESKPQQMMEGLEILKVASEIQPELMQKADLEKVTDDSLKAVGWPESWLRDEDEYMAAAQKFAEQANAQQELAQADQVSDLASKAAPLLNEAA